MVGFEPGEMAERREGDEARTQGGLCAGCVEAEEGREAFESWDCEGLEEGFNAGGHSKVEGNGEVEDRDAKVWYVCERLVSGVPRLRVQYSSPASSTKETQLTPGSDAELGSGGNDN